MKTTQNSNQNQGQNIGRQIRESYEDITNMADRINRKRMRKMEVTKDEEKLMIEHIRTAGELVFQKVMFRIQEDVVNGLIEMGILNVAAHYGGKELNRNFYSIQNTAKILRAIVVKLSPTEKSELNCRAVGANDLVIVNPSNCRAILKMAEDNFEVTLQERRELRELLTNLRWLGEPVKKTEVKTEAKAPVPPVEQPAAETVLIEEPKLNGTTHQG